MNLEIFQSAITESFAAAPPSVRDRHRPDQSGLGVRTVDFGVGPRLFIDQFTTAAVKLFNTFHQHTHFLLKGKRAACGGESFCRAPQGQGKKAWVSGTAAAWARMAASISQGRSKKPQRPARKSSTPASLAAFSTTLRPPRSARAGAPAKDRKRIVYPAHEKRAARLSPG